MTAGSIAVPTIVPLRPPIVGKYKNLIDTNTPIELKTETPNAEIFFTIDGSKPDPFAALGADRSTIKYTKPFRLREGKFYVKAIALSRDGARESNVVTKHFEVERPDEKENRHHHHHHQDKTFDFAFIDDLERERKKEILKKRGILKKIVDTNNLSFRSDGGSLSDNESSRVNHHRHNHHYRHHQDSKHGLKTIASFEREFTGGDDLSFQKRFIVPDSSTQTLRLQRETDFLKCNYCFAPRPQDPLARHCIECGKPLPNLPHYKLAVPENGKLGTCFFCKSTVPLNTTICVICENPINPQMQPQAPVKLQSKVTCPNCLSQNPANYATCLICECKLPPGAKAHPVELSVVVPQHPVPAGKSYTCSQCFRINRSDARFCDWCGAKPKREIGPLQCNLCGVTNNPYAKFCSACGNIIQSIINQNSSTNLFTKTSSQASWLSHLDTKASQILNKEYSTVSTQTYGLFYASSKSLEGKHDRDERMIRLEREFLEKRPPLTAISAGKGYWRQQMDHICAHLKAFAHNNAEFRAIISEPKLGKINSANVDIDSNWCTLRVTFPIRSASVKETSFKSSTSQLEKSSQVKSRLTNQEYDLMEAANAGRGSSLDDDSATETDSYRSENSNSKHRKKTKKKPSSNGHHETLSGEDRQLFKEVGKSGRGRASEVEYLIKEGANPNAKNRDGLTPLFVAIRNQHYDCVPVLIQNGADVKTRCPPKDNSVLHETVLKGPEASILIKMLIDNGASPDWKNSKNETAFDLAIKEKNTAALNVLGAQVGDNMIETYLKTKSNDIKQ